MNIYIINGPNLNMLGYREKELYGNVTYQELLSTLKKEAKKLKVSVKFYQSNHEGKIVDYIQKIRNKATAIIINPGALTHTSIALRDVLLILKGIKIVEVHLSDINNREEFRKVNYIKDICDLSIVNQGINGYIKALNYIVNG